MKVITKTILGIIALILININCVYASVSGDAQITGTFNGSQIIIKTSNDVAGSVGSLKWNGKEFVTTFDHGTGLQYAWTLNGNGGCENPTEAGSKGDGGRGNASSSILLSLYAKDNILKTESHPAFWFPPGFVGSSCTAVNTTKTSDDILKKTITIGWEGNTNIIEFEGTVILSKPTTQFTIEAPTQYLPRNSFNTYWRYNPETKSRVKINLPVTGGPNIQQSDEYLPTIISGNKDDTYSVGVYAPDIPNENIGQRTFRVFDILSANVSKWTLGYSRGPTPAGTLHYRTYLVIGSSIKQVTDGLDKLHNNFKTIFAPRVKGAATASCSNLSGWSGWDQSANVSNEVLIYADGTNETGVYLGSTMANITTTKSICDSLSGINCDICPKDAPQCNHKFKFATPTNLQDGQTHQLYFYGKNLNKNLVLLEYTPTEIKCPQVTAVPTIKVIAGDLDGDGKVNLSDYELFIPDFGKIKNPNVSNFTAADINKNGKVDIFDYNIIVKNFE